MIGRGFRERSEKKKMKSSIKANLLNINIHTSNWQLKSEEKEELSDFMITRNKAKQRKFI